MQNSQVLLIGFDDDTNQTLMKTLSGLSLETMICDEPFNGLADLIEDPGVWMACIVDARTFASDTAFQRYLQLFAYEGETIGMILGNADRVAVERYRHGRVEGVDGAIRDVTDRKQFLPAISAVLARRGYTSDTVPDAVEMTAEQRSGGRSRQIPARSPRSVQKASIRNRNIVRNRLATLAVAST